MIRYALVRGARTRREAEAYLPDNYTVVHETTEAAQRATARSANGRELDRHERSGTKEDRPVFVIKGEDRHGWTLDSYVIPRYGSGLIGCEEIDLSHPVMKQVPV